MARTSERAFNGLLAQALDGRHPRWDVNAEQTGVVAGSPGKVPDMVVMPTGPAGAPVVIETEYYPARQVEKEAESRLGLGLAGSVLAVEQAVAVVVPAGLRDIQQRDLPAAIESAEFCYRLASLRPGGGVEWFPSSGWLIGGVDDLAGLCEQVTVSEHAVQQAADEMERAVDAVSHELSRAVADAPDVLANMAVALKLEPSKQTTRIGVAMLANAFLFQMAIEGDAHPDTGWRIPGPAPDSTRAHVLDTWYKILGINYWPIFWTASSVLEQIPEAAAQSAVLPQLVDIAKSLARHGVAATADMAGQIFGKLIADRKFLATFYTRRESARLLAELAVARMPVEDWSDRERVESLKIADLACGTGALLSAAYDRVASRARRAGLDDAELHRAMMEQVLVGVDIMPAAAHLTCTALSAAHPKKRYSESGIHRAPYGRVKDTARYPQTKKGDSGSGTHIGIGSLELLRDSFKQTSWLDSAEIKVLPAHKDDDTETIILAHRAADLVIMNPPFTRPTNHAIAAGVPVPSFAGLGKDDDEQGLMASRLRQLSSPNSVGRGNAGLGSFFLDLAHVKIKRGGTIAFVLPLTVVSGAGWEKARQLLSQGYKDILVVSIADAGATSTAFSADTGMAEVLIIATRRQLGETVESKDLWVVLNNRPANPVEAVETARRIASFSRQDQDIGPLNMGDAQSGSFSRTSFSEGSGFAVLQNFNLGICGKAMTAGKLWLPRLHDVAGVALVPLQKLGDRGPVHRDINGYTGKPRASSPRGPFNVEKTTAWQASEYPMLWAHNARRESRLVVEPDTQGNIRTGMEAKAEKIWATKSRLHCTLDFRFNSQPLAACFTPVQCIGGTAWPTFTLHDTKWEPAVLLWVNSTLGLVAFWWIGSRQQQGRARLTVTRLPELPVLDPRALAPKQLAAAEVIFDRFKGEEFLPANEAYRDPTRMALDEAVLIEMLGLHDIAGTDADEVMESLTVLREQWCREHSVHGGKNTRPQP